MNRPDSHVPPGWYILCRSRELKQKPRRFVHAGVGLAAFRSASGVAAVVEDRCAHRGVPLSAGSVCGETLQCAYHGWQFDGQGKLAHVPALPAPACKAVRADIPAWQVCEHDGFVWIWSGKGTAIGQPHGFAHLGEPGWTSFTMRTRFRANLLACLENFLDCPHATFVHKYWFRAPTRKSVHAVVTTLADGAQAEFFEEPRERSAVWLLLAPRKGGMRHVDRFLAPQTSRVDYVFPGGLHYIITSSCRPLSDSETEVHTVISFRYGRIGWLIRLFFEPLSRWIIRQDVAMLALQQRNGGTGTMHSTEADLLGRHIIAWHRAALEQTGPPEAGKVQHADIIL